MPSELILQLEDTSGHFSCEQIDLFPSPKSAYIAIAFNNSEQARADATRLKAEIVSVLQGMGSLAAQTLPPCNGRSTSFPGCQALNISNNTKLMIVVSDGSNAVFSNPNVLLWNYDVLPVIKAGTPVNLPSPLNQANAMFWKNNIDEIIPAILGLTGVSESDQRIFISYRRTDTSDLAEQLFDRLNHEGFEVFLDRFSINPGVNFQNRLYQELADKAMVLLLESPDYQNSQWVQYEIDFAKKYRLGVLALNINDSPKTKSVDDEMRVPIDLAGATRLTAANLDALMLRIKQEHSQALYWKRSYLTTNILSALRHNGFSPTLDRSGLITAEDRASVVYKIFATPRPPVANDYHYTDISTNAINKFIVGPAFIEGDRGKINSWLAEKATIEFFNEGQILDLVTRIYP
jgi:hypothetical protein